MKPIKSPTPPVGAYNIHNIQVIDEEELKMLLVQATTQE